MGQEEYDALVKVHAEIEILRGSVLTLMLTKFMAEPRSDRGDLCDQFERSLGNRPIPPDVTGSRERQYYVDLSTQTERLAKEYADILRRQIAEAERIHPDGG